MNPPLRSIMDKGPWALDRHRVETGMNKVRMVCSSHNKRKNQHFLKAMLKVDAEPRFFLDGRPKTEMLEAKQVPILTVGLSVWL